MADKVFLHVGLPKTGTTYLQSVLWSNSAALRDQGVLLPGHGARDHMWATLVVREHPGLSARRAEARDSWERITAEVWAWPGTAIVSHEFFGAATAEQAARAISDLGGPETEVHVVVTARDVLTIVASYWQEFVKHGFWERPLDDFPADGATYEEWTWRTLDLEQVLRRWTGGLPPERVHVLVLPGPGSPKDTLWLWFAELVGIDGAAEMNLEQAKENNSLPVVEAEFMRRVSAVVDDFTSALDRGVWLRGYLAHGKLVPRGGDRARPSAQRLDELRDKAAQAVAYVAASGFDVRGDLELLRVPEELPDGREPSTVTRDELLDVAVETVAALLADVRRLRRENTQLKREAAARAEEDEAAAARPRRGLRRLRPGGDA